MTKRYYSSRSSAKKLTVKELYQKLQHLYLLFQNTDYFKDKAGISVPDPEIPDHIKHRAALALDFQPFPIEEWKEDEITEEHVFDVIEFLHDCVSKPVGELVDMSSEANWDYWDYESYDEAAGQKEYRDHVNAFLCNYKNGFEIADDGLILALGSDGLQYILNAHIVPYDEDHVDSKVRDAISKWRNRRLSLAERKEAIREMADVFEWLKKTKELEKVLRGKDDEALFHIANKFDIRHHNPEQIKGYDSSIWYSWMFHFYLATYHAVIRLLKKQEQESKRPKSGTAD
jgi:hypothetical protein